MHVPECKFQNTIKKPQIIGYKGLNVPLYLQMAEDALLPHFQLNSKFERI